MPLLSARLGKKSVDDAASGIASLSVDNKLVEDAEKPNVLVLGGCGFVGRNLVAMLVSKELCAKIRVVDRTMPAMAYMCDAHKAAFAAPVVEFKQADLSRQQGVDKAFDGESFKYVFNLTYDGIPFGQGDEVYEQRVTMPSRLCGAAAAKHAGLGCFVELSTAQVYEPNEKAAAEGSKTKPWTKQAAFKLKAEEELRSLRGLPLVVIRPATVYGPGDVAGLSPRVLCAAAYKQLDEKMRFLWDAKLRLNTVHVADVCTALWHVSHLGRPEPVYNLSDKSDSSQGSINEVLEAIFGISTGFAGTVVSTGAKAMGLKGFSEGVNEKHMEPWADACKKAGVLNTPLTPHIDAELLAHNHLACDGAMIEATGFAYAVPQLTAETLREQVGVYIEQKIFPPLDSLGPAKK